VGALSALSLASVAGAQAPTGDSASGSGTVVDTVGIPGGREDFAFDARTEASGVPPGTEERRPATGTMRLTGYFSSGGFFFDMTAEVRCLATRNNRAFIYGEVVAASNPDLVGMRLVFMVSDAGTPGVGQDTFLRGGDNAPVGDCAMNGVGSPTPSERRITAGEIVVRDAQPSPQCSDTLDNDSDGRIDFPADQGCSDATDNTEAPDPPQCSDRLDNDGDGKTNFPADPGCESATDDSESPDPPDRNVASVTLSPPDAVNPVGTSHTVTATARNAAGEPVPDATVLFSVSGSSQASGSCSTDAEGQCAFSYQGPDLPGADIITGCADADRDGSRDATEPCGEATKAWVLPTSTPGQTTGGGQILNAAGDDKIAFGFNAKSDGGTVKGNCTLVDPSAERNLKIKCLDVSTLVQGGTHATFFGRAEVNGEATRYRIDVDDNGEPGAGRDTFKISTDSGYTASGVLTNGNVQIHN
jgi:hypothetical protein